VSCVVQDNLGLLFLQNHGKIHLYYKIYLEAK